MMLAEFKPIFTALALPPAAPLLLAVIGLLWAGRFRLLGRGLTLLSLISLWLLSCNGFAVVLSHNLLQQVPVLPPSDAPRLKASGVQAIVVLGGGLQRSSVEYGAPQLAGESLERLRYGAWLAKQSGLPLAFSGGVGWSNRGTGSPPESAGAQQAAREWGVPLRWADTQSRDTSENARHTFALLHNDRMTRIALVTHASHLPRAKMAFETAGFEVVAAPMGFIQTRHRDVMEWLPSASGLLDSRAVLHEWLGLHLGRRFDAATARSQLDG